MRNKRQPRKDQKRTIQLTRKGGEKRKDLTYKKEVRARQKLRKLVITLIEQRRRK